MNTSEAQKYSLNITTFSQSNQSGSGGCITHAHSQIASESQLRIWHFPKNLKEKRWCHRGTTVRLQYVQVTHRQRSLWSAHSNIHIKVSQWQDILGSIFCPTLHNTTYCSFQKSRWELHKETKKVTLHPQLLLEVSKGHSLWSLGVNESFAQHKSNAFISYSPWKCSSHSGCTIHSLG